MQDLPAYFFRGKDYLRLAKDETSAKKLFQAKLAEAMLGSDIVYVISELFPVQLSPKIAITISSLLFH